MEERGHPSGFDEQGSLRVTKDESLPRRMLTEQFDVNRSTIDKRLKKLEQSMKTGWMQRTKPTCDILCLMRRW